MIVKLDDAMSVAKAAAWVMRSQDLAVIGTADAAGVPWAVPVNRAFDFDGRIIWKSRTDARHSQNLAANPRASAVLFFTDPKEGDTGLYLEGPVEIVTDLDDLKDAIKVRYEQAGKPVPPVSDFLYQAPDRVFRLTPASLWINEKTHTKTPVDLKLFAAALSEPAQKPGKN